MEELLNINIQTYQELFNKLEIIIKKNTISSISGPNNCGKTTFIKILEKIIKTNGYIKLNNKYIEEYSNEEYSTIVQTVIPEQVFFHEKNLKEELIYQQCPEEKIKYLIRLFKISKLSNKSFNKCTQKEIILSQIIKAISKSNNIIIIDNIDEYFNLEEIKELYLNFYKCIDKYDLTFIITCINLESTVYTDELFIIDKGKNKIHGYPLEVLEKDNILNKIGLELPFMIDLSVKLRDYDLIKEIELDNTKMIEALWK